MSIYDIYFSNFGRPPVPDDLCKDSAPRHPRFWRRFLKVFTIYGHGGHLGQWTATILAIFRSPNLRRLIWNLSKIGSGASEEKSFENVNGRTDDGRKVITIAHPEHSSGELTKKNKTKKTRGPLRPCNAHLSIIALWEPDLELIKANILIKIQNDIDKTM